MPETTAHGAVIDESCPAGWLKVFVCYDTKNDRAAFEETLKLLRTEPSHLHPYAASHGDMMDQGWENRTRLAVRNSNIMIVLCSPTTANAPGIQREIDIAEEENVGCVYIHGYAQGGGKLPSNVSKDTTVYAWHTHGTARVVGA